MRILLCVGLLLPSCGASEPPEALEVRLEQAEARLAALEKRLHELEAPLTAPELSVVLPTPGKPVSGSGRVSITVTPSQTFVDGEAVAQVALRAHLEALLAENPDASAVIQAEATVDHQRVVETLKTIKESGFERTSIATRSEE